MLGEKQGRQLPVLADTLFPDPRFSRFTLHISEIGSLSSPCCDPADCQKLPFCFLEVHKCPLKLLRLHPSQPLG